MKANIKPSLMGLFLGCYIFSSCSPSRSFRSSQERPVIRSQEAEIVNLSCEDEQSRNRVRNFRELPTSYLFSFDPICGKQGHQKEEIDQTKPLNLIFVIDITKSMHSKIENLRQTIHQLASLLERNRWQARYAAIGFSDTERHNKNYTFNRVDFQDRPEEVKNAIENWGTIDGGDHQEAGLAALVHAASLIADEMYNEPSRQDAKNVIIYASDAVAYFDRNNHQDFTTQDAAAAIRRYDLKNLYLYDITPQQADPRIQGSPAVSRQIQDLRKNADLLGKRLGETFAVNDLLSSLKQVTFTITKDNPETCKAQTVTLKSNNTTGITVSQRIPSEENDNDVFSILQQNLPLPLQLSNDISPLNYQLTIDRCCNLHEGQSTTCLSVDSSSFFLRFKSDP